MGTIAEQLQDKIDAKEAIKTSIINKGVAVGDELLLNEYAAKVDEISGGALPPTSGDWMVVFYDSLTGNIVNSQWVNNGDAAIAPTGLSDSYMDFVEWNADYSSVTSNLCVGSICNSNDGKSRVFITLTALTGLSPTLYFNKNTTGTTTIDWGDTNTDTSSVSGNQNKAHTYSAYGSYIITIDDTGGAYTVGNGGYWNPIFGTGAYSQCVTKIYLDDAVQELLTGAFIYCRSLEIVSLPKGLIVAGVGIDGYQFYLCNSLKHISMPLEATISPNAGSLFRECFALESVCWESLATMDGVSNDMFYQCYSILNFTSPNLAGNIPNNSHYQNYALRNASIPSGLTSIGTGAYQNCKSLREVVIPATVTSIGSNSFNGCTALVDIEVLAVVPPTLVSTNVFTGITNICKIYVPDVSVAAYQAATNWSTYANYIHAISTKP